MSTHRCIIPLQSKRSGFTLIELLVVVSIIAMLIAILLPALHATRQQAKAVKCLSQLKQIGMSVMAYATDHHDWGPYPRYLDHASGNQDGRYLWRYGTNPGPERATNLGCLQAAGYLGHPTGNQTIIGAKRHAVFDCPVDNTYGMHSSSGDAKFWADYWYLSTSQYTSLGSDPRYYKSRYRRIADMPGGVAIAVDSVNYTATSYVHPQGVNALYADSSADFNNVNEYQAVGNRVVAFDKLVWPTN